MRCEGYNDEGGQGEYDIRYKNYGHIRGAKAGDGRRAVRGKNSRVGRVVSQDDEVTR